MKIDHTKNLNLNLNEKIEYQNNLYVHKFPEEEKKTAYEMAKKRIQDDLKRAVEMIEKTYI